MQTSIESAAYEESIFDEEQQPVVYVGFWKRFAALFIDWLLLVMLSFIITKSGIAWNGTVVMFITVLAGLIYKSLMEYLYGATLGKKAMSIVVTNKVYEKPNLQEVLLRNIFGIVFKIVNLGFSLFVFANIQFNHTAPDFTFLQSIRGYPFALASIILLVYITDIVVFLADKRNRALHDIIGKTYVIKQ
jgi:uncharacterized RDD family membrane protein YckC